MAGYYGASAQRRAARDGALSRRDFGHMDVETTFDDPKMYTKPFTIKVTDELWPDSDIFEFFCNENEKDRAHMGDK